MCFPHIGMFSFLHRNAQTYRKAVYATKCLSTGVYFCVKRFWPTIRVANNSQEKFIILHVPHIGFLCYSDWDEILFYGSWLEKYMKDECIQLFQKRLSERMENGECPTELARPKRTVVTLFDMQNFISCIHLAGKWIRQLWTFVWGFLTPKTKETQAFFNWNKFLVSSYERPIVSDFTAPVTSNLEI